MPKALSKGAIPAAATICATERAEVYEIRNPKVRSTPATTMGANKRAKMNYLFDDCNETLLKFRDWDKEIGFRCGSWDFSSLDCCDFRWAKVASDIAMAEHKPLNSQIIVSSYVNGSKPSSEKLSNLISCMQSTGADVIKLIVEVHNIIDVASIFHMLTHCQVPLVATAVGSRGLISQLLAPKFGGFLVHPIPGLPTLVSLKQIYELEHVNEYTKIFALISNPVDHSKGPILHNPAERHIGYNGIYVPMMVDNVNEFFKTYTSMDFVGFRLGLRLLAGVKPSEMFLKSIPKEVTTVKVTYPSSCSLYLVKL
ncbi:hypothetical protein F8388_016211 [Cannabis sativa]|uniref:Uncharacterized protein n=1 Tax=Cannabis sativa TaxID=3483 RepID=A0A7J6DY08_CANSA|nr:hypothetical protein F8388_016211 [Cannabis sativa]